MNEIFDEISTASFEEETTKTDPAESESAIPVEEEDSKEDEPDREALLKSMENLYEEIERLKAELEETKNLNQRISEELGEFHSLFPETDITALPESIWEEVKNGIPLVASYALYEKKREAERRHAERINSQNAARSSGAAGKDTPSEYFSPDEVRAMSAAQVRHNYQKILNSMKKWKS